MRSAKVAMALRASASASTSALAQSVLRADRQMSPCEGGGGGGGGGGVGGAGRGETAEGVAARLHRNSGNG